MIAEIVFLGYLFLMMVSIHHLSGFYEDYNYQQKFIHHHIWRKCRTIYLIVSFHNSLEALKTIIFLRIMKYVYIFYKCITIKIKYV